MAKQLAFDWELDDDIWDWIDEEDAESLDDLLGLPKIDS